MSFKWQDKHMESFIEVYKKHECLWNNKCSDYSKSNEREKAYALMLSDLNIAGLTIADVKAKIKTVRTRYGAELAKIRSSELKADGGNVYEPRLFWFKDADKFLRNVCNSKPNYMLMIKTQPESSEVEREITSVQNNNDDITSSENSRDSPESTSLTNTCNNLHSPKKILKRSLYNNFSTKEDVRIKKPKQEDEMMENENPDEFDYFCKSLAVQLKKMPLQRALICQEKLQHVMTKERLLQLSELSSSPLHQNAEDYLQISSTDPYNNTMEENETREGNGIEHAFKVKTEI